MRFLQPILVALLLTSCSGARVEMEPAVVDEPPPVVLFRLLLIRDWDCPWYIICTEDHDFTLQEAIAFGIPAELWIGLAINGDGTTRYEIYWCRPVRC